MAAALSMWAKETKNNGIWWSHIYWVQIKKKTKEKNEYTYTEIKDKTSDGKNGKVGKKECPT